MNVAGQRADELSLALGQLGGSGQPGGEFRIEPARRHERGHLVEGAFHELVDVDAPVAQDPTLAVHQRDPGLVHLHAFEPSGQGIASHVVGSFVSSERPAD